MMRRFSKMHGLGNDFVVLDARTDPIEMTDRLACAIADRHTGIGCDQLIIVGPSTQADVSMRIFNSDGGEVEACGNASRCVPLFIGRDVTIETGGGVIRAQRDGEQISVDMGTPSFDWDAIPLAYAMDTLAMPTSWEDLPTPTAVNVGNPHVVFFVDRLDEIAVERLGRLIEVDPLFPEHVNVNFAQPLDRDHLRLTVWERGAGLTRACGTGACASAVAAIRRQICDGQVRVTLPGGDLSIEWQAGGSIRMTGPAAHVFDGEIDLSRFA